MEARPPTLAGDLIIAEERAGWMAFVTFSLNTCVMCYCAITAPAYTSPGPLSINQNGVFTFVITSGYTHVHTAHCSFH